MATFAETGLSTRMLKAVGKLGYEEPTPIQEQTIPLVLAGEDVIACAQTGTGKTASFCLPTMDKLDHADKQCGPLMLVVTPTRELADQIADMCRKIAQVSKHKVVSVVGGVSYNPQRQALYAGCDVLVATPGRLEDLMGQGVALLDQVEVLILDEADLMLDMGFLPCVRRIAAACTKEHQTLLFSATIDEAVRDAAEQIFPEGALEHAKRVEVARKGDTAATVAQYAVEIAHVAKPAALEAVFAQYGADRVIVFARTKYRADACARRIKHAGIPAEAIHSNKNQNQRRRILEGFAKGKLKVLVATDVLARGIDIPQVDYVVNYDLPLQPEDYVHRIGRTGRAGHEGFTISLVTSETKGALRDIQKLIGKEIPVVELENFDRAEAEAAAIAHNRKWQDRDKQPVVEEDPQVAHDDAVQEHKERKAAAKPAKKKAPRKEARGAKKAAELSWGDIKALVESDDFEEVVEEPKKEQRPKAEAKPAKKASARKHQGKGEEGNDRPRRPKPHRGGEKNAHGKAAGPKRKPRFEKGQSAEGQGAPARKPKGAGKPAGAGARKQGRGNHKPQGAPHRSGARPANGRKPRGNKAR